MKRALIVLFTLLLIIAPTIRVQPKEQHLFYLPLTFGGKCGADEMSYWDYVEPQETTNLVTNPSFETNTTGWVAGGINTIARSGAQSKFGAYSLLCTYQNNNNLADYAITLAAAVAHTFSIWIYIPANFDGSPVRINAGNFAGATGTLSADADLTIRDEWQRISVTFTPAADLVGDLRVRWNTVAPTAGRFLYVDAAQAEALGFLTTFCDGDQPGCEWLGAEHDSISRRSAISRAGGVVTDFDTFSWTIGTVIGAGMSPITNNTDPFAILPGAELNSQKTNARQFTLTGMIRGDSLSGLHANREALIQALAPNSVPEMQPVLIRYTGATVEKEIAAYYQRGLGGNIRANITCVEQPFAVTFLAVDPDWREIGESAAILDTNDTATLRYVTGRLRETGQWDDLGLTNNPTAGGVINAIAIAPNKDVYVGGNFTGMNNVAGRDYIARYTPSTDTWSTVGPAASVNGIVYALAFGPDGTLYIGGAFLNLGGANGDYVSSWTGAAFAPLAAGGTGTVLALTVGLDGTLYIGGQFLNWAAIPNADDVVSWNGVAYAAMGTGTLALVSAFATAPDGDIYAGGQFANIGGVAASLIARWDGAAWNALEGGVGGGIGPIVNDIAISEDGTVFAVGLFNTAGVGAITVNNVAEWNGTSWSALISGVNAEVFAAVVRDNQLYIGGLFTSASGLTLTDGVARWNGSAWSHLDVNLPGAGQGTALALGDPDPVVERNFDIYLGMGGTGAAAIAGIATVANDGTEDAFPRITVTRAGGTSAVLESVRNETLGLELLFDYALLDGETLTIDLAPTNKSIVSNFFGPRLDAILPNSDFGTWHLQPGDNDVSAFIDVAGAPVMETAIIWRDPYWSSD